MRQEPIYKAYLRQELAKRRASNPRYSLRAFASLLEMSPGSLSRAFSGKASLSIQTLERALNVICTCDVERARCLTSFIEEQQQLTARKVHATQPEFVDTFEPQDIDAAVSDRLVSWTHYAVMELSTIEGFKLSPQSAAKSLGISADEAESVIVQLLQLGLLKRTNSGLQKTKKITMNKHRHLVTSDGIKKCLHDTLTRAQKSIYLDDLATRNMTAMTIPIDPKKLPIAKLMIEQFVMQMSSFLSSGKKQQVYNLNVNLFPLQNIPFSKVSS